MPEFLFGQSHDRPTLLQYYWLPMVTQAQQIFIQKITLKSRLLFPSCYRVLLTKIVYSKSCIDLSLGKLTPLAVIFTIASSSSSAPVEHILSKLDPTFVESIKQLQIPEANLAIGPEDVVMLGCEMVLIMNLNAEITSTDMPFLSSADARNTIYTTNIIECHHGWYYSLSQWLTMWGTTGDKPWKWTGAIWVRPRLCELQEWWKNIICEFDGCESALLVPTDNSLGKNYVLFKHKGKVARYLFCLSAVTSKPVDAHRLPLGFPCYRDVSPAVTAVLAAKQLIEEEDKEAFPTIQK